MKKPQAALSGAPLGAKRLLAGARKYGIIIVIILLIILNIFRIWNTISTTETFVEKDNVQEEFIKSLKQAFNVNLSQVATIVIVATGMTLVIATGGIDLSVGAVMAIAGQVAPLIFMGRIAERYGIRFANALALTVPLVVAALFGLLNGLMVTRLRFQPIIATLVVYIGGARHRPGANQRVPAVLQGSRFPVYCPGQTVRHPHAGLYHVRRGHPGGDPHAPDKLWAVCAGSRR